MSTSDKWTFHHLLGGLAVGILSAAYAPKHKHEVAAAAIILFELVEQNILASWFKLMEPEPLSNTILDILMGVSGSSLAIFAMEDE